MPQKTDPLSIDEMAYIGTATYIAQKVEFALYGIVAHLSHLPEAQSDRRFKNLSGEKFLRGDITELKITLGQMESVFGKRLLIDSNAFIQFCEDRNLIIHNYYRLFHTNIQNGSKLDIDSIDFLLDFINRGERWLSIVRGLVVVMKEAAAEKEGRVGELVISEKDIEDKMAYNEHVSNQGITT